RQCSIKAFICGFSSTQIRPYRDIHTDVTGCSGQNCTDKKSNAGRPVQCQSQCQKQNHTNYTNRGVLSVQVGRCALLDRPGYLAHALISLWLLQDPEYRPDAVNNREHTTK